MISLKCIFKFRKRNRILFLDEINPRNFNQINQDTLDIIVKKGDSLSGEIYYYQNIPNEIKDMSLFITNDNNSYTIEKINGIT